MLRIALLFAILALTGCARSCTEYVPQPPGTTGGAPGTGGAATAGQGGASTGGAETGGATARCPFVEVKAGPRAVARQLRDRIIGGKPGSYSWAVSLQAGGHYCTGELVAQRWVLTAAHCCGSDTVGDRVVAGRIDLRDQAVGQVTAVAAVYKHEDYTTWQQGPDLCLLRLRDPVVGLQPVELADFVVPWGDGVVSGWGRTCETCPTSPVLLEAAVQVISPADCRQYYSIVNDTMLCAKAPGRDAAPGDSGGMLLQTAPNGQLVQVGVVSYGRSCSTTDSRCVGAYAEIPTQKAGILACIGGGL